MYKNVIMEFDGEKIDTTININQITSLQNIQILNNINDDDLFLVIDNSIWIILYRDEIDNHDCYLCDYIRDEIDNQ
jgi:hypothetical protein